VELMSRIPAIRWLPALAAMVVMTSLVGCETFRWGLFRPQDKEPTTPPPGGVPTTAALLDYLNDNSKRVQSLRCTDIDITASQGIQSFSIRGQMMAMKQRNFILSATALGSPVVDIGSNDNEFWFWSSKATPPYQFYCSYKDFEEGRVRELPFPFAPEWLLEVLSMGTYSSPEKFTVDADNKSVRLTEKTKSPQGQLVRKVIVMNRRPVSAPAPQVTGFYLYDDTTQKEICSAQILEVILDRGSGALVPKKLALSMPSQGAKLTLTMSGMQVNPQLNVASFTRQPLQGVQSYDLARNGGGITRTRGASR
jgi:hypothetical protein